jgi:hypothetical protein
MDNVLTITQGDTETLPIRLHIRGQPVTASDVKKVELAIESEDVQLLKTYPDEAEYASDNSAFLFKLSQQDTFSLNVGKGTYQVRIHFNDDKVKSIDQLPMKVKPSISKVVLT